MVIHFYYIPPVPTCSSSLITIHFKNFKVNHYFTSPHAWFIRNTIPGGTGLKYYERHAVTFDQDNDFDTMNVKAKGYERYSFGWSDPRALFGSNGP